MWHYHVHVFPRSAGDRLYSSQGEYVDQALMSRYAERVRQAYTQLDASVPAPPRHPRAARPGSASAEEEDEGAARSGWPDWVQRLPRRYAAAGLLLTDPAGAVLLVKPRYESNWEVPGGVVEYRESPPEACRREVLEELGRKLPVGPLLVVEHQWRQDRGDSVMFLYDGGTLPPDATLTLAPDELQAHAFVRPDRLAEHVAPRLARRLRAALEARQLGRTLELQDGRPR